MSNLFNFDSSTTELDNSIIDNAKKLGYEKDSSTENRMYIKNATGKQVSSFFIQENDISFTNHSQQISNESITKEQFNTELEGAISSRE